MTTRFLAEWCSSDGPQEAPDFDPDLCVYDTMPFDTHKDADAHAVKMAADGPCDDWWKVSEQVYTPYIYRGVDIGNYETVSTWISGEYVNPDPD